MAFTNQKIKLEVSDENILEKSLNFIEKALADAEGSLRIHVTKFFGDATAALIGAKKENLLDLEKYKDRS